ncbi:MAG: hypothetical protein ACRENN_07445 [Candidatus Eiseniibacteriota bacterium]
MFLVLEPTLPSFLELDVDLCVATFAFLIESQVARARMLVAPARGAARTVVYAWAHALERIQLAPLYAPDPTDLDLEQHLREAMEWLKRAQDVGVDRGISYGVRFGREFDVSYPETTGYVIRTFVEQEKLTGDADLLARAVAMGDWEIDHQLPNGAVMGGKLNSRPTAALFNTGMVLLGWTALIERTGEERYRIAARRAAEWMVSMQASDGRWVRGNSKFAARTSTLYNVKAAWGLCEAGFALGEDRFIRAALRNAEYCLSRQLPNGWLPDCCLTDPRAPLLHTLAYSMQGLIGIGRLTGRKDLIEGARRLADAELHVLRPDGFLPGRQFWDFSPAVPWSCLTGSAQTSIVWSELYQLTGDEKYRRAVRRVNRYLMARHDIRNADPRLRGGVPGSWPVWGDYARLSLVNWGAKFLADALSLEARISG